MFVRRHALIRFLSLLMVSSFWVNGYLTCASLKGEAKHLSLMPVKLERSQEQSSNQIQKGVIESQTSKEKIRPQRLFVPHWTTEESFSTTLYIRNAHVARALNIGVTLLLKNQKLSLPRLSIDSGQTVELDVEKLLEQNGQSTKQAGGAIIDFEAESAGTVNAFAYVADTIRSLSFTFPFLESGPGVSPLDGVAWHYNQQTQGSVALLNTSKARRAVNINVFIKGQSIPTVKKRLRPLETAIVQLPSPGSQTEGDERSTATVGIQYDGEPGDVVAQGWMMNEAVGFSLSLDFQPKSGCGCEEQVQHRYGAGIMLGKGGMPQPADSPAAVQFSPYLALSNRSDQPLVVEPVFDYEADGEPVKVTLPPVTLVSHESTLLNLRDFQQQEIIPSSVEMGDIDVQYHGSSGALIAEMASVDQNGSFVSPVPLTCTGHQDLHMPFWRTDGDWHSSLTIQNIAPQANDIQVTIIYQGGQYTLEKTMGAGSTAMISINDLQQSQEPDSQGRRLPKDVTLGGATVWSSGISDGLVLNGMFMNTVTKTCGQCSGMPYVIASTMSDKAAFTGSPLYSGCDPHPVNLGVTMYYNVRYSDSSQSSGALANSATSSNTGVATVSGSFVSPVAPGTTTINAMSAGAYFTDPACSQLHNLGPNSASLTIVPMVTVNEVGFTGDYQITKWVGGTVIDNPDGSTPTWKSASNPDYPVAYAKGALPTMFAKLGVSPSASGLSARIRVKNGSTVIAQKNGLTISGTSVSVTGVTTTSALETTVKTSTPTFTWEISFDTGTTWISMGNSGPHKMYWTYAAPLPPPFQNFGGTTFAPLYDLALDKACGYANGTSNLSTLLTQITQGVANETDYDPRLILNITQHPLTAYSQACLCADLAALLRGVIRSIGIDGTVTYIWAGNNASTMLLYTRGSTGGEITFRVARSATDEAEANPHFTYHAVVATNGTWYDPSYGLSYTSLAFTETSFNSTPQQTSPTFPSSTPVHSIYVCPH